MQQGQESALMPFHINELPDETLLLIFEFLAPEDLLTAEAVCQQWRALCVGHGNQLWRHLIEESIYHNWWAPYRPTHDLQTLQESKEGKNEIGMNYKLEFFLKLKSTQRWLKWASFRRIGQPLTDHGDDYGHIVKWSRNEGTDGKLGPEKIAIRALIVGDTGVGKNTLSASLARMFPDMCISLSDIHSVPLPSEEFSEQTIVGGVPFTFGSLPLELQIEVADIISVDGRLEFLRVEVFESVRPSVILLLYAVDNRQSMQHLRTLLPVIRSKFNDLPVLIIGTKSDRRYQVQGTKWTNEEMQILNPACPSWSEAIEMCYSLRARNYVECSVLTQHGIASVAREAAKLGVRHMLQYFGRIDLESRPPLTGQVNEEDTLEVHENIQCRECKARPIVGLCFKCTMCNDTYVCEECANTLEHNPTHVLVEWHYKKQKKKEIQRTDSFREGFRHRSSFICEANQYSEDEAMKQEKDTIARKGHETFQKTGLGKQWKENVEDIFQMFSKSPDKKRPAATTSDDGKAEESNEAKKKKKKRKI